MNLLQKFGEALRKLFFGEGKEKNLSAQEFIRMQNKNLKSLRDGLTELIYQRKCIEAELTRLRDEKVQLSEDVKVAAIQDRDELALHLMDRLEEIDRELGEKEETLSLLTQEAEQAKALESELEKKLSVAHSKLAVLEARTESLKMKEKLHHGMEQFQKEFSTSRLGVSEIEKQIFKMEAKMETLRGRSGQWSTELNKMRKERTEHQRQAKLIRLKTQLRTKQLPAASTLFTTRTAAMAES